MATVSVNLKRGFFAPDGVLYEVSGNPHQLPAEWADKPEQGEDESDEDFKARAKKQPYAVLPSSAEVVKASAPVVEKPEPAPAATTAKPK